MGKHTGLCTDTCTSPACAMQVREYKADLAKLQESSKGAAATAPGGAASRAELGLHDDYSQTSAGQRERLLQTTDKLGRTGERITQGRQQLLETEVRVHACMILNSAICRYQRIMSLHNRSAANARG